MSKQWRESKVKEYDSFFQGKGINKSMNCTSITVGVKPDGSAVTVLSVTNKSAWKYVKAGEAQLAKQGIVLADEPSWGPGGKVLPGDHAELTGIRKAQGMGAERGWTNTSSIQCENCSKVMTDKAWTHDKPRPPDSK